MKVSLVGMRQTNPMKQTVCVWFAMGSLLSAGEGFESFQKGGFDLLETEAGVFKTSKGHAEIHDEHAKSGRKSLRLLGGENHAVELIFPQKTSEELVLSFWAERWTSRSPFQFRIQEKRQGQWEEVYNGDKKIRVGGFLTLVESPLKAGAEGLRFVSTTPKSSGLMIDDLAVEKVKPMVIESVTTVQPVIPALIRKKDNPILGLLVVTKGRGTARSVERLTLDLEGTSDLSAIKVVRVLASGGSAKAGSGELFGEAQRSGEIWICEGKAELHDGENFFWLSVELRETASLEDVVDARVLEVKLNGGQLVKPEVTSPDGSQRIGYAVRQHGDDGSKAFRIPGLATTNKGTLIAVYDVRYRTGRDLPGDIDVGMSRSVDGGQTWEPMKVVLDMGKDAKWYYDGVGDPAVLVDRGNGRIWVIGTWSHGNRSWRGSGQGMEPEETGQLMLAYSDDDGVSWSEPINITKQVKKPDWHFLLQGPGAGITIKNGTIVFAAQYQDGDKRSDGSKIGTPFSTIIYSKDHGKTWKVGTGIKSNTTEAQVVELSDGSLMLNCRDNRGGARTVGVTLDMGKTWELHPTDRKGLNEPVCMASLLRMDDLLIFSNPNTRRGRYNMTIKVSEDEGMTWPEKNHTLYDARNGSGYSCLAPVGDDKVGVLYEGPTELYFLRFPLTDLVK